MNTYTTKPLNPLTSKEAIAYSSYEITVEGKSIEKFTPVLITVADKSFNVSASKLIYYPYLGKQLGMLDKDIEAFVTPYINPEYITAEYESRVQSRKAFIEKTEKLESELRSIAIDKTDTKKIDALDGLLVCEAYEFLKKIEDAISKRKTPKTTRQYAALMELRKQQLITCEV